MRKKKGTAGSWRVIDKHLWTTAFDLQTVILYLSITWPRKLYDMDRQIVIVTIEREELKKEKK